MPDPFRRFVDPDVDLHVPRQRREMREAPWRILGVIAGGGALGALARHGLAEAWSPEPGAVAWVIVLVNVSGCALIGVLMELLPRLWPSSRLIRPFWGVGVLGGYTTFSTSVLDVVTTVRAGVPHLALGYLGATLVGALVAVWVSATLTGRALDSARKRCRG
ncbi:fluoride efflux transporter FluC [Nocardiopsis ansamitocini]|uniref:Fluoride-specific ion channel FluC n=1 Tax=Nocardiopsis ansamitocini TaxID=1670832 RepID=A0A9W6P779_9ACTN|nr:CrcB family protein [Nocardiopsis ansamitocini]GLU48278.1 hypothetical protein Nans01_26290 [Nocardiopsis ansamitocini]